MTYDVPTLTNPSYKNQLITTKGKEKHSQARQEKTSGMVIREEEVLVKRSDRNVI